MNSDTKHFDRAASNWDAKEQRKQLAHDVAQTILALPLTKTMDAMEYGCGTGLVGLTIAPQIRSLTAIDTSAGMLTVLTDKIRDAHLNNITPLQLNLVTESFEGKFDLIFSSMTLHHVADTVQLFQCFWECLHPGAYLAIADLDKEDGSFHAPAAEGVQHHGFDRNALRNTLERLDFTDIHDSTVHRITKTDQNGTKRHYSVFLLSCRKNT